MAPWALGSTTIGAKQLEPKGLSTWIFFRPEMKKDEKRVDDLQRLWGISVFPSFRLSGLIHENPSFQLYSPHIIRILVFVYFVQLFFPWMRLVGATKKDKTRTKQKEDQDEATDRQM